MNSNHVNATIIPAIALRADVVGFPVQADGRNIGYANKLPNGTCHLYLEHGFLSGYYHLVDGVFVWSDDQRQQDGSMSAVIDPKTQELIDEIAQLRAQAREFAGTLAESPILDQLAVALSDLRAQNTELYEQVKNAALAN